MKSSTTNVETSINEEVFHEVSESFQRESSSSSLNDDVQQSPEEVNIAFENADLSSKVELIPSKIKMAIRNLIYEIPIWSKPKVPISIRCDSAPMIAKAYSQAYNGKSRHLGVRHSVIGTLIMKSLGKPLIMDKNTTRMCSEGTGRVGFARVLIEVQADKELKNRIEICYRHGSIVGNYSKFVDVEYTRKPPICGQCRVFGLTSNMCGGQRNDGGGERKSNDNDGKDHEKMNFVGGKQFDKNVNGGQFKGWMRNSQNNYNKLKKNEQNTMKTRYEFRP
nr:ATPase, F1/V1/A1 complex, alpha/beta subunit, zinc knuckle CX2CX4HX4C [Tanacetum cinerariifolium]